MIKPLTEAQITSLTTAASRYAQDVEDVLPYLVTRGVTPGLAATYRLGLVSRPMPGHEMFAGRLAIPYFTDLGCVDLRFRALDDSGAKYLNRPGTTPTLYNVGALQRGRTTVVVCYTPDTEVLTPDGWWSFAELQPGVPVAQWHMNRAEIDFAVPLAYHQYAYEGDLVHIEASWCDLLVTPDHRQPIRGLTARGGPGRLGKVAASEVKERRWLPVAGHMTGEGGPSEAVARLLVAWLADGCFTVKDTKISFNFKKERKKERIRKMLAEAGIEWTEHIQPATPAWTHFRIRKEHFAAVLDLSSEGKRWRWEWLRWDADVRAAMLDEIGHWDGDFVRERGVRLFTAEKQDADVVSAMAATTGVGAVQRADTRAARPEQATQYVVNLNRGMGWRQLGSGPGRVAYSGDVYCLTVPSGNLVVRRNGKVTVSSNCEGEIDALMCDGAVGIPAVGVPGVNAWQPAWARLFVDFDRVIVACDGDEPGHGFGSKLAKVLDNAVVIHMPDGHDVSSLCLSEGVESVRKRLDV